MHIFIVFHPQPTRCARVMPAPVWRERVDYKGNELSSTFLKDETWPSIHSWSAKKTAKRGRDGSRLLTVSGKPGCCCPKEEGPGPHLSISAIGGKGGNRLAWNRNPGGKTSEEWGSLFLLPLRGRNGKSRQSQEQLDQAWRGFDIGSQHCLAAPRTAIYSWPSRRE